MQKKSTNELNDLLENMKPDQLESYLKDNSKYMADEKNIKLKDVYSFAGVTESYGSKIVTMEKHTKDRDLIIRLCLAGHFNWDETNRALKLYGLSELYAKDPRDACIIVAVNNRIFDMYDIDEMLMKQGLKKLTTEE